MPAPRRRRRRLCATPWIAAAAALCVRNAVGQRWSYNLEDPATGPQNWWDASIGGSLECVSTRQSPINIPYHTDLTAADELPDGFFQLWVPSSPAGELRWLRNDGRRVILDAAARGVVLTTSGVPANMHLHYVELLDQSEHQIDGHQYDMEMRLVFRPQDAANPAARENVVVIALLFDSCDPAAESRRLPDEDAEIDFDGGQRRRAQAKSMRCAQDASPHSPLVHFITSHLDGIHMAERGRVPIDWDARLGKDFRTPSGVPNSTAWLDGLDKDTYAEYHGSFTQPPCAETVRWMINLNERRVGPAQLRKLREVLRPPGTKSESLHVGAGSPSGFVRPLQQLNGRRIVRRRYYGPVHASMATEFVELTKTLLNDTAGTHPGQGTSTGAAGPEPVAEPDDKETKKLVAAIAVLGASVIIAGISTLIVVTVRGQTAQTEPQEDDEGEDEEYEEGEEGEEQDEEDEEQEEADGEE